MVSDKEVNAYLLSVKLKYPYLEERFNELERLYSRKLWHQLTLKIEESLADPAFNDPNLLIPFYQNFVSVFAHKINLLKLARIAKDVAAQYQDPEAAGTRTWPPHDMSRVLGLSIV